MSALYQSGYQSGQQRHKQKKSPIRHCKWKLFCFFLKKFGTFFN
tara:strand:- start:61 stop:192 length:132 start_codon:yes stop_codon:yes gene_type:complete